MSFGKNENCPTSQELIEYQNGDLSIEVGSLIRSHLSGCEFCMAEIEFYTHYPQAVNEQESIEEPSEIPAPLYELAEALLKNRHSVPDSLYQLVVEDTDEVLKTS